MPDLDAALTWHGVSRRAFLAWCGSLAAAIGLGEAAAPRVAEALAARMPSVVWLHLGACTGCSESFAQTGAPDVATIVLETISLDYHETLMAAAGRQAEDARRAADGAILIVEGAVVTAEAGQALRIGGATGAELLADAASRARLVVALGSCAWDGGWMRTAADPAGARGVAEALPDIGDRLVALPGCPPAPDWLLAVLLSHVMLGRLPARDASGRPRSLYGTTVHDGCPRRGHFENGEFVERPGDRAERDGWCLYPLGCRGPETLAACPSTRFGRSTSWCVESGSPCVGCAGERWVQRGAPFSRATDAVTPGIGGLTPGTVGTAMATATGAAMATWGARRSAHGTDDIDPGSRPGPETMGRDT